MKQREGEGMEWSGYSMCISRYYYSMYRDINRNNNYDSIFVLFAYNLNIC